jgi:hypothetical protein
MNLDIPTSTTAEDEVQDHQAVEKQLQPRGKARVSSNLTREKNDHRDHSEHSEGYVPEQERADDKYNISEDEERADDKYNISEDEESMTISEDEEMTTTVEKGKQKMV